MMEPELEEGFVPGVKKRSGDKDLLEEQKMRHKLKQVRSLIILINMIILFSGTEGSQEGDTTGQRLPFVSESEGGEDEGRRPPGADQADLL